MYRVIGDDGKRRVVYLHYLVVRAFHGTKPFPKAVTRHLDGNAQNNRPENLCWGTVRENVHDSIKHGTFNTLHHTRTNSRELVEYWRALINMGWKKREIADLFKVHWTLIGKWTNGIYV